VSVISAEDIERIKPETTAKLLENSLGVGFRSYGALGAVQNVQIRGARSSQVDVYLDGVLMTNAQDRAFDVNSIPVSSIDHVEIIRSGAGSLGKANSLGGMVNIVTRKGEQTETPFTIAVETGSFLPEQYQSDGETKRNIRGLADSIKLDASYGDSFGNLSVAAGLGALGAQNNYTYESGEELLLREHADMWKVHGNVSAVYDMEEAGVFSLRNVTRYQHAGVPGSLSWPTPENYQNDFHTTTSADYKIQGVFDELMDLQVTGAYTYERIFFHDSSFGDSTHHRHKAGIEAEQRWNHSDAVNFSSGIHAAWDGLDSTDAGEHDRYSVGVFGAGNVYLADRNLSLHPVARVDYVDAYGIEPDASLGAIYNLNDETALQANTGYARRLPTYNELYWVGMGNPDLGPETGWMGDLGITHSKGNMAYEGTVFVRDTRGLIYWDLAAGKPKNISRAFFLGAEQEFEVSLTDDLAVHASYLLNYSWDLSNDNTFAADKRVAHTRMHTLHAGISAAHEAISASLNGKYLGKTEDLDSAVIIDAVVNWQAGDRYALYAAVDNLLNTRYQLNDGYPMPGTKIRLGSTASF